MSIIDNIKSLIQEMAFERDKAESKITDIGIPVLLHLIKILKWEDKDNYDKHIKDINGWLFSIKRILIKPKGKRFKPNQYYSFLFEEQIKNVNDITNAVYGDLQNYHNLKVINTDREVYNKLKNIYKQLSNDISDGSFMGIQFYVNIK